MIIYGLHHLIAKLAGEAQNLRTAAGQASDPAEKRQILEQVKQLEVTAAAHGDQLYEDQQILLATMELCSRLGTSPHQGETRKQILAHIKDATGLLIMEIGSQATDS